MALSSEYIAEFLKSHRAKLELRMTYTSSTKEWWAEARVIRLSKVAGDKRRNAYISIRRGRDLDTAIEKAIENANVFLHGGKLAP